MAGNLGRLVFHPSVVGGKVIVLGNLSDSASPAFPARQFDCVSVSSSHVLNMAPHPQDF